MAEYVIMTDSSADLTGEMAEKSGVLVLPLRFTVGGQTYFNWPDNRDMDPAEFYGRLRQGEIASTAAVNLEQYVRAMEPVLQEGRDILVLSFSSALSGTYASSRLAAEELGEKYPQRKIFVVDTLSASLGQGLLVWLAVRMREQGEPLEQVRDWVEENKLHLCHQFTVDDLHFLKRGGRISATTAVVGTMLQIKPVLHMDNEGRLVNIGKARGRKASLNALVDRMEQTAIDPAGQTVFISHGDCREDAEYVAQEVKRRMGVKDVRIGYVGPVIGAHSGPGTVALFYLGRER